MEWYEKIWLCVPIIGWTILLGYYFSDWLDKEHNDTTVKQER